MSVTAASLGWEAWEPITLPGFDLLTVRGREAARIYLRNLDPDFVVMALPCTEWPQLQNVSQRTPMQVRRLRRKRKLQRTVLCFFDEVAQWQHERGRHGDRTAWMLENPLRSLAWQQEPSQATQGMRGVGAAVTDACVWEKRRPDTGEGKKPTMVVGTPAVVATIDTRCTRDHEHGVIEGAMHHPCGASKWKKIAVSDWAGGYTAEFCRALLQGA